MEENEKAKHTFKTAVKWPDENSRQRRCCHCFFVRVEQFFSKPACTVDLFLLLSMAMLATERKQLDRV
jgi:hypothetical protein